MGRPATGKTPIQHVRAPKEEWDIYKGAAGLVGSDASKITREFVRWFTRQPGAKLPQRPTVEQIAEVVGKRESEQ